MKPNRVCPLDKCTGCYACYNICPNKAISFEEDKYGNVYPIIDSDKCIGCNLCRKTCPALSKNIEYSYPIKCYAAYSKSERINKKSSSGGVAYEIGKKIVSNGGVYYGVSSYLKNGEIQFERISKIDDLEKVQGSKYVHAHINNTYTNIKKDLNSGIDVLFIASPCQIAGLKCYLKKDYNNLYLIDIICHGVPSQKLLQEEINYNYDYVSFRFGKDFNLVAKKDNRIVYKKNKYNSKYYHMFLKGINYRENCYSCKYAKNERVGDITIGDFWGLSEDEFSSKNGISVVLINNEKGLSLFNDIDSLNIKEENIKEAISNNAQLNHSTIKTKQHIKFLNNYNKNINKDYKKIYKLSDYIYITKGNIKEKLKKFLNRR